VAAGSSIDASVRIEAGDRAGIERLVRYCRTEALLTPHELLEAIAKFVPPPRVHRHRHDPGTAPSVTRVRCGPGPRLQYPQPGWRASETIRRSPNSTSTRSSRRVARSTHRVTGGPPKSTSIRQASKRAPPTVTSSVPDTFTWTN
jgi:hypothetical protein